MRDIQVCWLMSPWGCSLSSFKGHDSQGRYLMTGGGSNATLLSRKSKGEVGNYSAIEPRPGTGEGQECLGTLDIGLPTANHMTGLSDFSHGMSGFVEDRKAVEVFWGGLFWGFLGWWDVVCFFVLRWSCIFCFLLAFSVLFRCSFFGFVYLKFIYDFSIILNVLRVVRYKLDYWMVRR